MLAVQEARQAVGLTNELKREEASLVHANAIPSTSEVDSGRRSMSKLKAIHINFILLMSAFLPLSLFAA